MCKLFSIRYLLLINSFLSVYSSVAQEVYDIEVAHNGIYVGNVLTLEAQPDNNSCTDISNFTDVLTNNFITLYRDPDHAVSVTGYSNEIILDLTITLTDVSGNSQPPFSISLGINPDNDNPADKQKDVYFIEEGYYKVSAYINSIKLGPGGSHPSSIPQNLYLKVHTNVERYYLFNSQNVPGNIKHALIDLDSPGQVVSSPNPDTDYSDVEEMEISWDCQVGAEYYELEWTHVNDFADDQTKLPASSIVMTERDFALNSTRVTTSGTAYRIPLLYDRGFIAYRIRSVATDPNDRSKLIRGGWSDNTATACTTVTAVDCFTHQRIKAHQSAKKWQSSFSFAEEGKKKAFLNYMDGSQRSRQMVTRNNSDYRAIVSETYYDHQGRPKINVLPVPADQKLDFYDDFNQGTTTTFYPKAAFDEDRNNCSTGAPAMGYASGASRYYSTSNSDQAGIQGFLPNAYGYPFTEVEYESDNTQTVKRQGGVGPDYQLGSGHETRYFYATPEQEELDRLFGTRVGYAKHYRKIVVIDPNGQASITYQDMAGNVIATALTGNEPSNVQALMGSSGPLNGSANTNGTVDMLNKTNGSDPDDELDNNFLNASEDGYELAHTFVLPGDDNVSLNYEANIPAFQDACITGYQPVFDLKLAFWSTDCNVLLDETEQSIGVYNENGGAASANITIDDSGQPFDLNAGGYRVEKSLVINQNVLEAYAEHYAENASCLVTLQDFIDEAWTELDTIDCDTTGDAQNGYLYDCDACVQSLGSLSAFQASGGTQDQYDELVKLCQEPCEEPSGFELIGKSLQADVSPGGQYATYEVDENGDFYSDDPLSIFYQPANESVLPIAKSGTGVDLTIFSGGANEDIEEVILSWNENDAKLAEQYHPEYEYFDELYNNALTVGNNGMNSEEYDWLIQNTNTYAEAQTAGFVSSVSGNFSILDDDPLFKVSGWTTRPFDALEAQLLNYEGNGNMFNYAASLASCANWYGSDISTCTANADDFGDGDAALNDRQWNLAKNLYLAAKGQVISTEMAIRSINGGALFSSSNSDLGYFTGGIGYQYFNFYQYVISVFPFIPYQVPSNQQGDFVDVLFQGQMITGPDRPYYKDKVRRINFPDKYLPKEGAAGASENEQDAQVYERTGMCPIAFDLKIFINYLAQNDLFTEGPIAMQYLDGYTKSLYEVVENGIIVQSSNYVQRNYSPSFTSSTLTVDLVHANGGSDINGFLTLSFESGSDFNWTNYNAGSFSITNVRQLVDNGSGGDAGSGFALEVEIVDDEGKEFVEVLTGSVSVAGLNIDLTNCSINGFFDVTVVPNAAGNSVEELLNTLISQSELLAGNVPLQTAGTGYASIFDRVFKRYLDPLGIYGADAGDNYGDFMWDQTGSSNVFEIVSDPTSISPSDLSIQIEFCPPPTASFPNGFTDVEAFRNFKPVFNTTGCTAPSTVNFEVEIVSFDYDDAPDPDQFTVSASAVIKGRIALYKDSDGPGGNDPVLEEEIPLSNDENTTVEEEFCADKETDRQYLENLIKAVFLHSQQPVYGRWRWDNYGLGFSDDMQRWLYNYIGDYVPLRNPIEIAFDAIYGRTAPNDSDDYALIFYNTHQAINYNTEPYDMADNSYNISGEGTGLILRPKERSNHNGYYPCILRMQFINQEQGLDFMDITDVLEVKPKPGSSGYGGLTNEFLVLVEINGTNQEWVQGSSCFELAPCDECTPVTPPVPVNCWSKAQELGTYYNQNVYGADEVTVESFCETRLADHVDSYISYLTTMGVDDVTSPFYISLAEFARQEMNFYTTDYYQYIVGVLELSSSAQIASDVYPYNGEFITLQTFAESELSGSCVSDYITYYGIATSPVDITEFCFGYASEYPCPLLNFRPAPRFVPEENPCVEFYTDVANSNGQQAFTTYIEDIKADFKQRYIDHCLSSAVEKFNRYGSGTADYQYTLYYYDQAGNLVQTVPPQGVEPLDVSSPTMSTIRNYRENGQSLPLTHDLQMVTSYRYNSLNQLVIQTTPDGGTTNFWYDGVGQLVLSQNEKQNGLNEYSYTRYDRLGRIVETGLIRGGGSSDLLKNPDNEDLDDPSFPDNLMNQTNPDYNRYEVSLTFYDELNTHVDDFLGYYGAGATPENLRKRVSSAVYYDVLEYSSNAYQYSDYDYATHYSYDEHGNVKRLVQDKPHFNLSTQRFKKIDYDYDLVSGNVNEVSYQRGEFDQLLHRYTYDADNRIVKVESSRDGIIWDRDAGYEYYPHGPLARTELGEFNIQGLDYAYTLQGWLKSVNSSTLKPERDMGNDGLYISTTPEFAPDVMAFSLHYNANDYQPIKSYELGSLNKPVADIAQMNINSLYNGNIAAMVTSHQDNNESHVPTLGMHYTYDQLNRLHEAVAYISNTTEDQVWSQNDFNLVSASNDYKVSLTYDGNGNIQTLQRNGYGASGNVEMDNLTYNYHNIKKNRLLSVTDELNYNGNYPNDIDNMPSASNYDYDAIGNLIYDESEEIDNIEWLANGKIKAITRTSGSSDPDLEFEYDAMGNRVTKIVKPAGMGQDKWTYTHYVRDASGNVMAVYKEAMGGCLGCEEPATHEIRLSLLEHSLYGSDRLGVWKSDRFQSREVAFYEGTPPVVSEINFNDYEDAAPYYSRDPREKNYELKNHLGNVLATVSGERYYEGKEDYLTYDDFEDGDTYGWLYHNPASDPTQISNPGDYMLVETTTASGVVYMPLTLKSNTTYTVTADIGSNNAPGALPYPSNVKFQVFDVTSSLQVQVDQVEGPGSIEVTFTTLDVGTERDLHIRFAVTSRPQAFHFTVDNFKVKEWIAYDDFEDGDTYGWLYHNPASDPTQISNPGDYMLVETTTASGTVYMPLTLKSNTTYTVRADIGSNNAPGALPYPSNVKFQIFDVTSSLQVQVDQVEGPGSIEVTFTTLDVGTERDLHIRFAVTSRPQAFHFTVDNFKVKENAGKYVADVISAQDYYPFGSTMPGRTFNGGDYRYGFNGKEMDNEVSGNGNQYDYGFRIYNPRLGRFLSVDPLSSKFAWNSPYAFAENDVIRAIDLEGLEKYYVTQTLNNQGGITKISIIWYENIQGKVSKDIEARPSPTPQNYAEAMVVTKDQDGNQVGAPELRALNALETVALKRGKHIDAGTGGILLPDGRSTRRTRGGAGANENAAERVYNSIYIPNRQGFMTTSRGNITSDDALNLDNKMVTSEMDDVIKIDVIFSNQGMQDNLFEDVKSGLQEKYPGAAINPVINADALDNNWVTKQGRHISNDASGQPNAVGLIKYESKDAKQE